MILQCKNQKGAPDAILPVLYQPTKEWKTKHQADSWSVGTPMRPGLLAQLRVAAAIKQGWLTEQKERVHLAWDPEAEADLPGQSHVTQSQMLAELQQGIEWAQQDGVLTKFSPARLLPPKISGAEVIHIPPRAKSAQHSSHTPAPKVAQTAGLFIAFDDRLQDEGATTGEISAQLDPAAATQQAVRALRLHSSGNTC